MVVFLLCVDYAYTYIIIMLMYFLISFFTINTRWYHLRFVVALLILAVISVLLCCCGHWCTWPVNSQISDAIITIFTLC